MINVNLTRDEGYFVNSVNRWKKARDGELKHHNAKQGDSLNEKKRARPPRFAGDVFKVIFFYGLGEGQYWISRSLLKERLSMLEKYKVWEDWRFDARFEDTLDGYNYNGWIFVVSENYVAILD